MSQPLRVALVSHQVGHNDGQGRVAYEIAVAALQRGYRLTILAERCDQELAQHPQVHLLLFDCKRYPIRLLKNLAFASATSTWLKSHKAAFDILQVNGFITWPAADVNSAHFVHAAWLHNKYYSYKHWWRSGYAAYQRFNTALNTRLERNAFDRAGSVVAVSQRVADELRQAGVTPAKTSVIHNGVDTNEFRPGTADRAHFSLPGDVPLFLFAGDIRTTRKNLDTLLKALRNAPQLHLAVAGDLKDSPYPAMTRQLGISDRVHFLNKVREMPLLMRSVDAFVFPSRYEPFGLVILEAMASGTPVITSRNAGGSDLLGEAGFILEDPEDERTLSQFILKLAENKQLRQEMGNNARHIALSNTWTHMAVKYLDLYETIYAQS